MNPLLRVAVTVLARVEGPGVEPSVADALIARWGTFFPGQLDPAEVSLGAPNGLPWFVYALALLRKSMFDHGPRYDVPENLRATRDKMLRAAHQAPPMPVAGITAPTEIDTAIPSRGEPPARSRVFAAHAMPRAADDSLEELLPLWDTGRTAATSGGAKGRPRKRTK